jgi:hypothetical protein
MNDAQVRWLLRRALRIAPWLSPAGVTDAVERTLLIRLASETRLRRKLSSELPAAVTSLRTIVDALVTSWLAGAFDPAWLGEESLEDAAAQWATHDRPPDTDAEIAAWTAATLLRAASEVVTIINVDTIAALGDPPPG